MKQYLFALRNISDKFIKIVYNPALFKFYWQTYILSKFESVAVDIYFVSYPKCGRTWLRFMLRRYLELCQANSIHFRDRSLLELPDNRIIKFAHDQGSWIPAPPRIERLSFDAAKYRDARVIFMARDPRDVLVSSWYHLKFRENIYQDGLSEFIRDELIGVNKVIAFMNMWLENRRVPDDFLLLTYEQMRAEPLVYFCRLLDFIGLKVDQPAAQKAVLESSLPRMKQAAVKEEREAWLKPGSNGSENSMKVRRGQVGGFHDELSPEDIAFLNDAIRNKLSPQLSDYQDPL